jgi:hypothetical protein
MIEVIRQSPKRLKFLGPKWSQKMFIDSYVQILQRLLHSSLFFLLNSNFEPKWMLYMMMMVSTPMPLSPHTKRMHPCCDDYLNVHIIGYVSDVGIDRNLRICREIILTVRGIKSSHFTHFTSNLAMLGMLHYNLHTCFTHYI